MLKKWCVILMFLILCPLGCYANEPQMNEALVKIINQIQAIKPLLVEAVRAQPKNPRIKIHFKDWTDSHGVKHAGVRTDLNQIQSALIKAVNRQSIEPRKFRAMKGDFTGDAHV